MTRLKNYVLATASLVILGGVFHSGLTIASDHKIPPGLNKTNIGGSSGAKVVATGIETLTVGICGFDPTITQQEYSGVVPLTITGSIFFNPPSNGSYDAFYGFTPSEFEPAGGFRFAFASQSQCTCAQECQGQNTAFADALVGQVPAFDQVNHDYSVLADFGSTPDRLAFGIADCGCDDNAGDMIVTIGSASPTYIGLYSAGSSGSESDVTQSIATGGSVGDFYVSVSNPPGQCDGDDNSMTFTLRKEQAGTELVCEIAGSDTQCNAAGCVDYQKGDQITVEMSFTDNCGIGGTRVHWNAAQVTNHLCK